LEKFGKFLTFYFRYIPPCFLVAIPLLAIIETSNPWPAANTLLSARTTAMPIAIGWGERTDCAAPNGSWSCKKYRFRQYIFLPTFLLRPTITTVTEVDAAPLQISGSGPSLGIMAAVTYVFCALCTWFVWLRPKRPNRAS
jgi:hypothetical protein